MIRRKTTTVRIGDIVLSSETPVVVQSMLNTSTMNTEECVEQAIRIIRAGGQLVRITAQGVKEAENLKNIREALRARGYNTPLSADIHFNAEAAIVAARYVEKVRINPGNFVDKRATFKNLTYTDEEYQAELENLTRKFTGFLSVCREHHTAVRIGTNHGSLSDRIMSRYGNTPAGMVEATMEYLRVCRDNGFNDVVISLKSSDCQVMVSAVRLLVAWMEKEGMDYPLHLGVTEAGEGEDGRIRSAVGIGTLLNEGVGDTIRVSLTEEPECEIPVAKALVSMCDPEFDMEHHHRRGDFVKPFIVADISRADTIDESVMLGLDFVEDGVHPVYGAQLVAGPKAPEMIYTQALGPELTKLPAGVVVIVPADNLEMAHVYNRNASPLLTVPEYKGSVPETDTCYRFVRITKPEEIDGELAEKLSVAENDVLVFDPVKVNYHVYKEMLRRAEVFRIANKVIVKASMDGDDKELINLRAGAHLGGLFLDRLVSGIWISAPAVQEPYYAVELSRNILQSAGLRRYKTEFVSCPGCGRTLFNLQEAVALVKQSFSYLTNLKIAVMGCVVNGPGEMGDADYGYVGAGNGKVNLYKGKEIVRVAVPEKEAIEALKQLIMENGDWKDK